MAEINNTADNPDTKDKKPDVNTPATPTQDTKPDEGDTLGEGGLKALRAEREARAEADKRLADALKKIDAYESEKRTEAENLAIERDKAIAALEDERKARADAERAVIAREVVAEMGIPLELAGRLQGATREEMVEDAKVFAAIAKPKEPTRPAPIGVVGGGNHAPLSNAELFSNAIGTVL